MNNRHLADAIDRNPFSAEAMELAAHRISTGAHRADAEAQIGELAAQGFTHFPTRVSGDELDEVRAELDRLSIGVDTSRSSFGGYRTKRVFNLAGNSRAFDRLITDPLVIATVEAHLQDQIQLSEISSIQIEPGEVAQTLHHDDGCYPLPRPHPPLMVSAIWAIDPFTEANGASRVLPGSHLEVSPDLEAAVGATLPLEMAAGSVGLWDGRLIHGGGANHTERPRRAVAVLYARAWLRQQENQYLCIDRATVAGFDRDYQRLLGWSRYGPHTGIVGGRDPGHLLRQR
ncbi:MAG: phytanoyl-CoA dioxygenase family protein [Acidimicrobiia bacterium]|nr:phytanoyl-CoA dioxygenase family protein [Acidimicrobiia bacterium]